MSLNVACFLYCLFHSVRSHLFFLMSVFCFNAGSNGQVTYGGVTEEGFIINPVTGVITTTKELDAELQDHYTLTGTVHCPSSAISTYSHKSLRGISSASRFSSLISVCQG